MNSELSEKQLRAITLLTAGQHGASVAETLNVTPQTVSRWRQQPKFLAALNQNKQIAIQAAIDHMQAHVSRVTEELVNLGLNASSEEIRRKACTDVINFLAEDLRCFSRVNESDPKLMALNREADSYSAYSEALQRRQLARSDVEFYESKSKG